jgi:hypothetical protein
MILQMVLTYYISGNIAKDKNAITELINKGAKSIILTNTSEQIKFLGVLLLNYCFENLKKEFSDLIKMTVLNVDDNFAALWSAKKLGYDKENNSHKKIKHNFKSPALTVVLSQ